MNHIISGANVHARVTIGVDMTADGTTLISADTDHCGMIGKDVILEQMDAMTVSTNDRRTFAGRGYNGGDQPGIMIESGRINHADLETTNLTSADRMASGTSGMHHFVIRIDGRTVR
jgi:hypothetical protein